MGRPDLTPSERAKVNASNIMTMRSCTAAAALHARQRPWCIENPVRRNDTKGPWKRFAGTVPGTQTLKFHVKLGRQFGVHVSPTATLNGMVCDTSSGWGLDEWRAFLDPHVKAAKAA